MPQIEVSFEIDFNGIVSVEATDQATGRRQAMMIHPSGGLSQSELSRLIAETLARAPEERTQRRRTHQQASSTGLW